VGEGLWRSRGCDHGRVSAPGQRRVRWDSVTRGETAWNPVDGSTAISGRLARKYCLASNPWWPSPNAHSHRDERSAELRPAEAISQKR
jgi:hypothetical protein